MYLKYYAGVSFHVHSTTLLSLCEINVDSDKYGFIGGISGGEVLLLSKI